MWPKKSNSLVFWLMALMVLPVAATQAAPEDQTARRDDLLARVARAVDAHVIPSLQNLAQKTKSLTNAIEMHCSSDDIGSLNLLEATFAQTVEAWAGAQHLRFGPLRDAGRVARFHFWPDPRGVTGRQMRRIFHEHDPKLLDRETLAKQSVAVQGLGALETYVLSERDAFANGPPARSDDYECLYARGVCRLMEAEADAVVVEWTKPAGWRERLISPTVESEIYRSADESAAQLVKSLLLGLELVREQNIVPLYDLSNGTVKRVKVPFQRLGLNDEAARAALASLRNLNDALALTDYAGGRTAWVKDWTANGFSALSLRAETLDVPEKLVLSADDFDVSQLRQMRFYTNALRQVIARQTAPSAGLTIGFNELDGD